MLKVSFAILFCIVSLFGYSLEEAFIKAKKDKKLILVEVSKENCPYCTALEREIFNDTKKVKEIEKRYVIVKLKREKDQIPSFLDVKYYPSTYLLKSNGTIVDEIPGYVKSSDFMEFIEEVYRQEKKFL